MSIRLPAYIVEISLILVYYYSFLMYEALKEQMPTDWESLAKTITLS